MLYFAYVYYVLLPLCGELRYMYKYKSCPAAVHFGNSGALPRITAAT